MRILKLHPLLKIGNSYVFDSPQPANLSYAWNFGSLLAFCLVIQIVSGVTLAMHYVPSVTEAFNSVEHIMRDVNYGWFIRYLHANTASAFFFLVYLHIGRGLYYGSYKAPRTLTWTIGTVMLILMMAIGFLGYVLPFGQMSLWGATVITNLLSAIPWLGQDIVEFVWGGFSVNNATLNRFFALHFVLPFVLTALALMHLIVLHDRAGSGNPLGISGNYDRIPFAPYFIFKDLITIFLFIFVLSLYVFFMPNVLGDSENYVMANPMQTPPAIVPEWYLLPFYAILRSIPNKLLGVIAMFASILIILILPVTDLSRSRGIQFRPLSKIAFYIFVVNFLILMQLGAKHVESPFIELGQISTAIYFSYFILIVPCVTLFENTLIEVSLKTSHLTPRRKTSHLIPISLVSYYSKKPNRWDLISNGLHFTSIWSDLNLSSIKLNSSWSDLNLKDIIRSCLLVRMLVRFTNSWIFEWFLIVLFLLSWVCILVLLNKYCPELLAIVIGLVYGLYFLFLEYQMDTVLPTDPFDTLGFPDNPYLDFSDSIDFSEDSDSSKSAWEDKVDSPSLQKRPGSDSLRTLYLQGENNKGKAPMREEPVMRKEPFEEPSMPLFSLENTLFDKAGSSSKDSSNLVSNKGGWPFLEAGSSSKDSSNLVSNKRSLASFQEGSSSKDSGNLISNKRSLRFEEGSNPRTTNRASKSLVRREDLESYQGMEARKLRTNHIVRRVQLERELNNERSAMLARHAAERLAAEQLDPTLSEDKVMQDVHEEQETAFSSFRSLVLRRIRLERDYEIAKITFDKYKTNQYRGILDLNTQRLHNNNNEINRLTSKYGFGDPSPKLPTE